MLHKVVEHKKPIFISVALILVLVLIIIAVRASKKALERKRAKEKLRSEFQKETAEDKALSDQFDLPEEQVSNARNIAFNVATIFETHKDLGWFEKYSDDVALYLTIGPARYLFSDSYNEAIRYLNEVKSKKQMNAVEVFYREDFTNDKELKIDIEEHLSTGQIKEIKSYRFL